MTLKRSFLDSWNADTLPSWLETSVPAAQSLANSQSETLLDAQSQAAGSLDYSQYSQASQVANTAQAVRSDEARQHRNEFKIVKRVIERSFQETSNSISLLHEKTSKVNLGISDLHSDLKKLERTVMFENDASHSKTIDMEIKLNSIGEKIESRLSTRISDNVANAIASGIRKIEKVITANSQEASIDISTLKDWQDGVNQTLHNLTDTVYCMEKGLQMFYVQTAMQFQNPQPQDIQTVVSFPSQTQPFNFPGNQMAAVQEQYSLVLANNDNLQQGQQNTSYPHSKDIGLQSSGTNRMCITTLNNITDNRTSRLEAFSMAQTMSYVDSQYPSVLDKSGWPIPAVDSENKRYKLK